jgi:hypothetical protein
MVGLRAAWLSLGTQPGNPCYEESIDANGNNLISEPEILAFECSTMVDMNGKGFVDFSDYDILVRAYDLPFGLSPSSCS